MALIEFDNVSEYSACIKVFGVGGGGTNAVNSMINSSIMGVEFIVANTDLQSLEMSNCPFKIQIGGDLTKGLGAGSNPDVGKKAAEENEDQIREMLNGADMVFITAGMGGGTGTGAAPVIAKMAREMNILTVGIVTTPFSFEGKIRNEQAQIGIENLRDHVDSLIIINNNKLREVYGNLGFKAGFSKADEVLSTASKGIAEVITHHYTQNIDLKDAKTVLSNSGTAIMGAGSSSGNNRAHDAISNALDSPLLNDNKISGAKNVLLLIVSGNQEITIDEIGEINEYIQDQAGGGANIIMGVGEDSELEDSISVTVIATGFNPEQQNEISNTEPEKIIHKLAEDNLFSNSYSNDSLNETDNSSNTLQGLKIENDMEETEEKNDDISHGINDLNDEKIVHVLEFEDEHDIDKSINFKEEDFGKESIPKILDTDVNEPIEVNDYKDEDLKINDLEEDFNSIEWSLFDENMSGDDFDSKTEGFSEINIGEVDNNDAENNILSKPYIRIESKINSNETNSELIIADKTENDSVDPNQNPLNTSISDFQNQRSTERRLRMKEFNYKFNKSKIDDIETEPAFKRRGIDIKQTNYSDENHISRTSVSLDENDDTKIRKNNSFLHDNVD
jgi:cell division protein FtsZ